jgi:DNA gyrase/topoisomerase IV subunit B
MAVPQQLLQQLLALDESVRLEIAHTLLESVDAWVDHAMSDDERKRLDAALDRSIAQADAGQGIPVEHK